MITRRQFSQLVGVGVLSTCLPLPSFAASLPFAERSVRVFGIGGAGRNMVEFLSSQVRLSANCSVHTFNRPPEERPSADSTLHLTATEADRVLDVVGDKDVVFLFVGLGGETGTKLTPPIARLATLAGATVVAVLVMPFDWESPRRNALALQGRREIEATVDSVHVLENQLLVDQFPDLTFDSALERVNRLAVQVFLDETARWGVGRA